MGNLTFTLLSEISQSERQNYGENKKYSLQDSKCLLGIGVEDINTQCTEDF